MFARLAPLPGASLRTFAQQAITVILGPNSQLNTQSHVILDLGARLEQASLNEGATGAPRATSALQAVFPKNPKVVSVQ